MDLVGIRNNGIRVYFEVKGSAKRQLKRKADYQFAKAYVSGMADRFVFVTKNMIKRRYIMQEEW